MIDGVVLQARKCLSVSRLLVNPGGWIKPADRKGTEKSGQ